MHERPYSIEHDFHRFDAGNQRAHVEEIVSTYGIPKAELLAQSADPFNAGTDLDCERAKWFRSLYDLAGGDAYEGHLRDLHYKVNALRPDLYDGSGEAWDMLQDAKKIAVNLGVVAPDALDDRSIARQVDADRYSVCASAMSEIAVPEAEIDDFSNPHATWPYPAAVLPIDLMLWVEKPSPMIEAEILPVCRRYGVDVRFGRGSPGQTFVGHLARRAAARDRELVIVALSDADKAGGSMARALAKTAEIIVRGGLVEGVPRLRVVRAGLTMEQVAGIEEQLGREIPRTIEADGVERVELQALPAFVPGELGRLVEEAVVSVIGDDWQDIVREWKSGLDEELAASDEAAELVALHGEVKEFFGSPEFTSVRARLEAFEDRRCELVGALQEIVDDAELPEISESETDWLLDTRRLFVEQVQAYRRHDGLEPLVFEERLCVRCGTPISGNPKKIYCSDVCRKVDVRVRRAPALPAVGCVFCGSMFQPWRRDQRFCSSDCRERELAESRRTQRENDRRAKRDIEGGGDDA